MSRDTLSVTVARNGETIVTIETNCLCGRDLTPEDEQSIRDAAWQLLAFIGDPHPEAWFMLKPFIKS